MGGVVQIGRNKSDTVSKIEKKKPELMTGTLILIILQAIFFFMYN